MQPTTAIKLKLRNACSGVDTMAISHRLNNVVLTMLYHPHQLSMRGAHLNEAPRQAKHSAPTRAHLKKAISFFSSQGTKMGSNTGLKFGMGMSRSYLQRVSERQQPSQDPQQSG